MKILDCTLRDGGHSVGFDWPMEMAQEYFKLMQDVNIDIIELGYWKQTNKYNTPFFNLNLDVVKEIVGPCRNNNASIMIDYHYCLKDLCEYPTKHEQDIISLIRVCSRKQDVADALEFCKELKAYTDLDISFNIFNISNYTQSELYDVCNLIINYDSIDYVYFADTHGNLDLSNEYNKLFKDVVELLNNSNKKVGFHFHNHTGNEYNNFKYITNIANITDTTIFGIGKGAGNLKLEQVINSKHRDDIILFIQKYYDILKTEYSCYYFVSGCYSVCESYAQQAEKNNMPLCDFIQFCKTLKIVDKDVYRKEILYEYINNRMY